MQGCVDKYKAYSNIYFTYITVQMFGVIRISLFNFFKDNTLIDKGCIDQK